MRNDPVVPGVGLVMALEFAVTWDYRCPFARNARDHILAGLAAGADRHVTFAQSPSARATTSRKARPTGDTPLLGADPAGSIRIIERVVDLPTGWPDLNEFKHTTIPR